MICGVLARLEWECMRDPKVITRQGGEKSHNGGNVMESFGSGFSSKINEKISISALDENIFYIT